MAVQQLLCGMGETAAGVRAACFCCSRERGRWGVYGSRGIKANGCFQIRFFALSGQLVVNALVLGLVVQLKLRH